MIRLGEISFINALPISLPHEHVAGVPIEKTVLPPKSLNQAILSGKLDITPVSSAFYLRHKQYLKRLDGLSISAVTPVESVLLFTPKGLDAIHQAELICVPDTSETSIALMQYIVYAYTGIKPTNLQIYPRGQAKVMLEQGYPVLAIGDEALMLKVEFGQVRYPVLDLAEAWQDETNLPFVFAVWVARDQWVDEHPEWFELMNQLLLQQKEAFFEDYEVQQQVFQKAFAQCPHLPKAFLTSYITHAISYNLDDAHEEALHWFEAIVKWLDNEREPFPDWSGIKQQSELLHR